jgi:putative oxidoreductase
LGWFGGGGFQGTMQFFTENMGIPLVFSLLAIVAEFFGALGLIVGFLGRISALDVGAVMVVAARMEHENGFFMNWSGDKAGEGIEYHFLAIAMALVVIITGSGVWSIDRAWSRRR